MKIEGESLVPGPRERVFALFVDEAVLRRCVPGVKKLEREGEDRFAGTLEVGVGSVKGVYDGTVTFKERAPPERLVMQVEAKGKQGFAKGTGSLRFEGVEAGGRPATRVVYEGDVQVGGTIASVGQRMVQGAAKVMAGQFFAAIEAEAKALEAQAPPPRQGPFLNLVRWLLSVVRGLLRPRAA